MPGATAWIRPTPPVPCETAAKRSLGRSAASTVGSNGRPVWEVLIGLRVGIDQGNQHHGVCPVFQWCRLPCAIARCDPVPGSRSGAGSCDHRRLGTGQELSVAALPAEGFQLYPVNLQAADRYRAPFSPAGRKDDNRDAMVLAEIQRTSRHHLQPLHRKSETLRHSGQSLAITIPWWEERTRPVNQLTPYLHAYYPRALELFADLGAFLRAFRAPARLARGRTESNGSRGFPATPLARRHCQHGRPAGDRLQASTPRRSSHNSLLDPPPGLSWYISSKRSPASLKHAINRLRS